MKQLFFARDNVCTLNTSSRSNSYVSGSDNANASKLKQRRLRKAQKLSVVCSECSAEYHIACLVQSYKDYVRGNTKS